MPELVEMRQIVVSIRTAIQMPCAIRKIEGSDDHMLQGTTVSQVQAVWSVGKELLLALATTSEESFLLVRAHLMLSGTVQVVQAREVPSVPGELLRLLLDNGRAIVLGDRQGLAKVTCSSFSCRPCRFPDALLDPSFCPSSLAAVLGVAKGTSVANALLTVTLPLASLQHPALSVPVVPSPAAALPLGIGNYLRAEILGCAFLPRSGLEAPRDLTADERQRVASLCRLVPLHLLTKSLSKYGVSPLSLELTVTGGDRLPRRTTIHAKKDFEQNLRTYGRDGTVVVGTSRKFYHWPSGAIGATKARALGESLLSAEARVNKVQASLSAQAAQPWPDEVTIERARHVANALALCGVLEGDAPLPCLTPSCVVCVAYSPLIVDAVTAAYSRREPDESTWAGPVVAALSMLAVQRAHRHASPPPPANNHLPLHPVVSTCAPLPEAWQAVLQPHLTTDAFRRLCVSLTGAGSDVHTPFYPPPGDIFRSVTLCRSPSDTRLLILGQDPYHGPSQADGLSFSIRRPHRQPPSLKNIFKEIGDEFADEIRRSRISWPPDHGDLSSWARQGVLLLNQIFTVAPGTPMAHGRLGWQTVTGAIIRAVVQAAVRSGTTFVVLLWGGVAAKMGQDIEQWAAATAQEEAAVGSTGTVHVLTSGHPSPLSVRHFMGNGHFAKANELLGSRAIDWLSPARS